MKIQARGTETARKTENVRDVSLAEQGGRISWCDKR